METKDTPSKTAITNSGLHNNDIVILESLTPTVDSDDEREVVTVGNAEGSKYKIAVDGADMSYLNYYVHKMPWRCTQCHKAFPTKQGAGDHYRAMHRVQTFSCETSSASYKIKVDQSINYFKDVFVCSICNNTYDGGQHRPRSLPCGHGVCSLCVESYIAQGNKSCIICMVWHGANSANKLPVSFLREELIHKATISTPPSNESNSALEYLRVALMKEKKEKQMLTIQKQIQSFMNIEKYTKTLLQNKTEDVNEEICRRKRFEKEVKLLLIKIEQSNQKIIKKQKPQVQIQDAIKSCQLKTNSMEKLVHILRYSTDNQISSHVCYLVSHEIEVSQKLEETLMKELNLNVDTPRKTIITNSELLSNDLVMLDSPPPTVDSDDEREVLTVGNDEDTPHSGLQSNDLVMLHSPSPTVYSDDEKEDVTVGNGKDTPRKSAFTNSGLQRNNLVMLDSPSPSVDSDDEREVLTVGNDEDTPHKTAITNSELQSNDLEMLDSPSHTVDSDDEREVLTVGNDEGTKKSIAEDRVSYFYSRSCLIINNLEKPWSCALCPKSFSTKKRASDHILDCHRIQNFSCEQTIALYLRKRDQIGQYFKDVFECYICKNTYDGGEHRPRSLPCGHGFCTLCIKSCIARENKSCPVCGMGHGANSANKLPVCFLLEELLHKATKSTSRKDESEFIPEQVIVNLIKDMKEAQILPVHIQTQRIMYIEKELYALQKKKMDDLNEEIYKRHILEEEVEMLLTKIEKSSQEILRKQKPQQQIQDTVKSCRKTKKVLEMLENKLRAASNNHIITQEECHLATNEVTKSHKWEETLPKELNFNLEKYAKVKRKGIILCSRVLSEGEKAIIPNLSRDAKPSIFAILIKEDELNLTSATTTTVFLDLSAQGINLGRVYIRVLSNRTCGKQFVMLALGTNGSTLRGANFEYKYDNRIQLMNYVTENKSKSCDLFLPMENETYETVSKGSLYRFATGCFQIWTTNVTEKQKGFGYFGYVIAGLEVIDRAASDEFAIKDITIRESGIVLGY